MQDHHPNQEPTHGSQLAMQKPNTNLEELPLESCSRKDDWLSRRFNSILFILYKLWLILNLAIALMFECIAIFTWKKVFKTSLKGKHLTSYICFNLSVVLLSYGCAEMLFAMNRRKSIAAQRSLLKFQYYLVGFFICYAVLVGGDIKGLLPATTSEMIVYLYAIFSPFVNLIGGYAVLKAFKENHPLQRQANYEASGALLVTDFLEQNKAIASELSKYDKKLETWPYVIYNWWLKFTVVYEISFIFSYFLFIAMSDLSLLSTEGLQDVAGLIFALFNAYSRFEMEAAMRTKKLVKSKRAVLLLKISVVSSILTYLFIAKMVDVSVFKGIEFLIPSFERLGLFAAIPLICLVGAFKVHKLIEERDSLAQFSSFAEESYL